MHLHQHIDEQYHMMTQIPGIEGTCKHVHVCFHSSHYSEYKSQEAYEYNCTVKTTEQYKPLKTEGAYKL